ncbi:MAG: endonuclease III [Oscillospiraceae bacterium]|nr:endonuclease III [Oscillospiraceae bacterium]
MNKKQKTAEINRTLTTLYPEPVCELNYNQNKPHELLIAARLSAQCTDKRVNQVTPALFARFPTLTDFAYADVSEVEEFVRSCGLYKTKAHDIVETCKMLVNTYNCTIPDSMDELIKLPGIGRKTANLLLGTLYGKPAIVTDTHVIRLSNRFGLVNTKNPEKVESALKKLIVPEESLNFCHRLVLFGREFCKAQSPKCAECGVREMCTYIK